jgi:hypothetical protein
VTTVALLGVDLILSLAAVALWAVAAVRGGLFWALGGATVLLARMVTVLVLAGRGWELAAERVTVGVPLGLLVGAIALGLLVRGRRNGRPGSVAARVLAWGPPVSAPPRWRSPRWWATRVGQERPTMITPRPAGFP